MQDPPASLGRSVVVDAGHDAPAPWAGCPRVEIDANALVDPGPVVERLHEAWSSRTPVVISLGVDPARFRIPRAVVAEPWTLGASFELWEDRLQFLVWANSYDARGNVADPVWWWARKAARLGATLGERSDIVLADGRPAWVDGGPRGAIGPDLAGAAVGGTAVGGTAVGGVAVGAAGRHGAAVDGAVVIHCESVERDRLTVVAGASPANDSSEGGAPASGWTASGSLADDQLAAVRHDGGPARIIAPAGSGKTRVLTERLRYLLGSRSWDRDAVLAVAYNKKAQEELDARTVGLGARTRTLNSLGLWVLTSAGAAPRLLEERETRRIVERLAPAQRHRANTDPIGPYLEALSTVRLGLVDPEVVEAARDDVPGLAGIFPLYRAELRSSGAVDFDEQIYAAVELLLADGDTRRRLQLSCRHLLVDEFQDLTPAHVLLLRLLALPALDVFGVGDDDQVIYGHAGADPAFLIDYEQLFPGAADHRLEVNYRCPPAVVTAAGHLLSYNDRRVPKKIRAGRTGGSSDDLVVTVHAPTAGAASVVEVVTAWLDAGVATGDIAVLTRVNSLLLAPQVALAEAGVPMASVLRPDVLERTGLRAALAYLRLATADELASRDLIEVLRRPSRGLPPWFSDRLRRRNAWSIEGLLQVASTVAEKDATKVERLVDDLIALRGAATAGSAASRLVRAIRDDIGLGGAMSLLDQSRGAEGSSHLDDLDALEQVAALHPDAAGFEMWLRAGFTREAAPGGVTLSTVHRVKGMEWDRVVVYGVSAGIVPHRLADDVEEERRVLHVAITRGREQVVVLSDRSRPSPFLAEMDGTAPRGASSLSARSTDGRSTDGRSTDSRSTASGSTPGRSTVGRAGEGPSTASGSTPGRSSAGTSPAGRGSADIGGDEGSPVEERFERLRSWRRSRSQADKVSAFIVCSDKTLRAIARAEPSTLVELRAVEGIGPTKLELYGEEILTVISGDTVTL
jgi:DNA helicase-2/ATP-dependent DNA helicase PcrA